MERTGRRNSGSNPSSGGGGNVVIQDIRHDLLKIAEPYQGRLERDRSYSEDDRFKSMTLRRLFVSYLRHLCDDFLIRDFSIEIETSGRAHVYDVHLRGGRIRPGTDRLSIHVDFFVPPWCNRGAPA